MENNQIPEKFIDTKSNCIWLPPMCFRTHVLDLFSGKLWVPRYPLSNDEFDRIVVEPGCKKYFNAPFYAVSLLCRRLSDDPSSTKEFGGLQFVLIGTLINAMPVLGAPFIRFSIDGNDLIFFNLSKEIKALRNDAGQIFIEIPIREGFTEKGKITDVQLPIGFEAVALKLAEDKVISLMSPSTAYLNMNSLRVFCGPIVEIN